MAVCITVFTIAACRSAPTQSAVELWLGGDLQVGNISGDRLVHLAPQLAGAIGIVNLEGAVTDRPEENRLLFNHPAQLATIARAGVRVAGIANNHAHDAGAQAPEASARRLRAAGILPAGGPAAAAILNENSLRIAVTAHDLTNGVPADLVEELMAARRQADVLIATFHVTAPSLYLPRRELREAVAAAKRAGAAVIAAHGSHAIAPVEREGETVVVYGLGNLAFTCDCTDERDAIIVRVRLEGARVVSARVIPIEAGLKGQPARPAPRPEEIFDLLEAIGSTKLVRVEGSASF